jgi:hypothetical protein
MSARSDEGFPVEQRMLVGIGNFTTQEEELS